MTYTSDTAQAGNHASAALFSVPYVYFRRQHLPASLAGMLSWTLRITPSSTLFPA
jgi:hypothetical protein